MSQTGTLMGFVHRRRRGAELFLLVIALAVGIGAYAAVGLGVDGEVPANLAGYGGWLTALIVAAHVTVRLVAPYADPVPQALVLTAIVIGFGLLAFSLVLAHRVHATIGTDDVDEVGRDR